jgi:hypothetical protein
VEDVGAMQIKPHRASASAAGAERDSAGGHYRVRALDAWSHRRGSIHQVKIAMRGVIPWTGSIPWYRNKNRIHPQLWIQKKKKLGRGMRASRRAHRHGMLVIHHQLCILLLLGTRSFRLQYGAYQNWSRQMKPCFPFPAPAAVSPCFDFIAF